jgi:hypothetical protein
MYADNFAQVAQAINEHRYPRSVRRRIRDEGFWSRPPERVRRSKRHRRKDRAKAA